MVEVFNCFRAIIEIWILPREILPELACVSAAGFGPLYFVCHLGGRKIKVFYSEIVKFWNVQNRIFFHCCDVVFQMCQSKRRATASLNQVLNPPKKDKQQHKRPTRVPKPPSLPIYVFPMADKQSDKLRVLCQYFAKPYSGRRGAKELRVHRNTLDGTMERYRYLWHVQYIMTDGK